MKTAIEMVDRMEALCRKIALWKNAVVAPGHDNRLAEAANEARAIVSELPEPVDPDLAIARNIVAEAQGYDADGRSRSRHYRAGDWDTDTAVKVALSALRRAREEGIK